MEMDDFGWESSPVTDYEIGFPLKTGDNSYSNYGGLDLAEALFRHAEPRKMEGPALPSMDTARWLATVLGASSTTIVHPNPPLGDQLCINVQDEEEEMPSILSGSEIFPNTSSSGSASSGESENYPDVALQGLPQNIQSLKRKDRESGYAMGAPLRKETGFRINFERQARFDFRLHNGYEPDVEAIAQVKEMIYRAAAMRPINSGALKSVEKPKRKNVKISSDPQTVAARQRRERISERLRVLQSLVPGGSKMDTASMLDEAANYLKFLKSQVNALKTLGPLSSSLPPASLFDRSFAQMQMGPPNVP